MILIGAILYRFYARGQSVFRQSINVPINFKDKKSRQIQSNSAAKISNNNFIYFLGGSLGLNGFSNIPWTIGSLTL